MKKTTTQKKLVLAKETVRDLSRRELTAAGGGSGIIDSWKYCLNHPRTWTC